MAQKKKEDRKRSLKKPRLIVTVAVTVLIAAIFLVAIQAVGKYREKEMFMSLRNDMKSLQVEFEKVDAGWEYSESCSGEGDVFNRSEPAFCTIILTNEAIDATSLKLRFERYEELLQPNFVNSVPRALIPWINSTQGDNRLYKTAGYTLSDNTNVKCLLREFYTDDEPSSEAGGINFSCSHSASEFYFPRSDI